MYSAHGLEITKFSTLSRNLGLGHTLTFQIKRQSVTVTHEKIHLDSHLKVILGFSKTLHDFNLQNASKIAFFTFSSDMVLYSLLSRKTLNQNDRLKNCNVTCFNILLNTNWNKKVADEQTHGVIGCSWQVIKGTHFQSLFPYICFCFSIIVIDTYLTDLTPILVVYFGAHSGLLIAKQSTTTKL